jgi:hypothetical protein
MQLTPGGSMAGMFCNSYLVKSHKTASNTATTKAREKICTDLESLEFFDVCLTKFENYQILLNKYGHSFLVTKTAKVNLAQPTFRLFHKKLYNNFFSLVG